MNRMFDISIVILETFLVLLLLFAIFGSAYAVINIYKELPIVEKRCREAGYDRVIANGIIFNEYECYNDPIEKKIARGDYDVH